MQHFHQPVCHSEGGSSLFVENIRCGKTSDVIFVLNAIPAMISDPSPLVYIYIYYIYLQILT